jgi:hypothetical protein
MSERSAKAWAMACLDCSDAIESELAWSVNERPGRTTDSD